MDKRILALTAMAAVVLGACSGSEEPSPTDEPVAGAVVPADGDISGVPLYSPVSRDALRYALPTAISGLALVESPADVIAADEQDLADDPLIRRSLVELGLGPDVISIVQRETTWEEVPDVSVTAVQFRGQSAQDYAEFVPSVYLLATSVTKDQHNLTGAKPPRREAVMEGREVQTADWGAFDVVWYAHGDVVFIVLAKNPQLLASALRSLPPLPGVA